MCNIQEKRNKIPRPHRANLGKEKYKKRQNLRVSGLSKENKTPSNLGLKATPILNSREMKFKQRKRSAREIFQGVKERAKRREEDLLPKPSDHGETTSRSHRSKSARRKERENVRKGFLVSRTAYYKDHVLVKERPKRTQILYKNHLQTAEQPNNRFIPDPSPIASKRMFSPLTVPRNVHQSIETTPNVDQNTIVNQFNFSTEKPSQRAKTLKSSGSSKLKPVQLTEDEEADPLYQKPISKKLVSFDSPPKPKNKESPILNPEIYCNCPKPSSTSYACSNSTKWLQEFFPHFDYSENLATYNSLLNLAEEIVDEVALDQIQKDLVRTFQTIDLFVTPSMKLKLLRILKALVVYDNDMGYIQGMNYIAASLGIHCEESVVFWLCTGLFEKHEIRELYTCQNFESMLEHLEVFDQMLLKYIPEVHQRFEEEGFDVKIYMMNWILTFMCSYIPLNWQAGFFNDFFKHGWKAFYALCLGIHEFCKDSILECSDMEQMKDCVNKMKENRDSLYCRPPSESEEKKRTLMETGNLFASEDGRKDLSVFQRTKDEDWETIFKLSKTYLDLLLKNNN